MDAYEAKFRKPEVLWVDDTRVELVDLYPEKIKTEMPLLVLPGWSATAEIHKENVKILARLGRRVLVISSPYGAEVLVAERDMRVPLAELRKARTLLEVLEKKGIWQADVVAHSEGALFTTLAALQNPERFRNIVYYAPAGLIGDDSFWGLVSRFGSDVVRRLVRRDKHTGRKAKSNAAMAEMMRRIKRGSKAAVTEVRAIAETHIQESLKALRARGIKIVIMHPVGDKVFPMCRMQRIVKADMVDGFVSVGNPSRKGDVAEGHNSWYLSPEVFAVMADSILDILDKMQRT